MRICPNLLFKFQNRFFCQLETNETKKLYEDAKYQKFKIHLQELENYHFEKPKLRIFSILLFCLYIYILYVLWDIKSKYEEFKTYIAEKLKIEQKQKNNTKIKFDDIIGIDNYKAEILEIVEYFKNKKKYDEMGAEVPKGVLLYGKPGTGKTMLAQALANESNVNFIYKSSSDFLSKYLGQSSNNVRKVFEEAAKKQPCIIFIDEIETIARNRNDTLTKNDAINQLLVQMDGFNKNDQIIVIGATNRLHALDPAVLRPGRFDKIIQIPVPNKEARKQIVEHYLKKVNVSTELDLDNLLNKSSSFTGADIKNLINIAALNAVSEKRSQIVQNDIDFALDKIMIGNVREDESQQIYKLKSAYTQGGIALVSYLKQKSSNIHKISIQRKKQKESASSFVKNEQEEFVTKKDLWNTMLINSACRTTEKIFFGDEDYGNQCLDYLRNNELLAKKYLRYFNEAQKFSPYVFNNQSQKLKGQFDQEINSILNKIEIESSNLITQNKDQIIKIANELMKKKTLEREQIKKLLEN